MARRRLIHNRISRVSLMLSGILTAAFIANILIGKMGVLSGSAVRAGLGDVAEFVLLLVAMISFTIAILALEKNANRGRRPRSEDSKSIGGK